MTEIPLPGEIGRPATGRLAAIGIDRLEQLTTLTEKELMAVHGVGPKAVRILREALAERGLGFRDPGGDEPPAPDAS